MFHLEKACQAQIAAMSTGQALVIPPVRPACAPATSSGERSPIGRAEWPAMLRLLDRIDPAYKD